MNLPSFFCFAGNSEANDFATLRADIMFGKNWKNRADLALSRPSLDQFILCDNQTGLSLEAARMSVSSPRFTIRCLKDLTSFDPAANVAAEAHFYATGKLSYQAHYAENRAINPPDGTPSQVDYDGAGRVSSCRYVHSDGDRFCDPATAIEVAKRMTIARQTMVAGLCDGTQDFVALESGKSHRRQQPVNASQQDRYAQKR